MWMVKTSVKIVNVETDEFVLFDDIMIPLQTLATAVSKSLSRLIEDYTVVVFLTQRTITFFFIVLESQAALWISFS